MPKSNLFVASYIHWSYLTFKAAVSVWRKWIILQGSAVKLHYITGEGYFFYGCKVLQKLKMKKLLLHSWKHMRSYKNFKYFELVYEGTINHYSLLHCTTIHLVDIGKSLTYWVSFIIWPFLMLTTVHKTNLTQHKWHSVCCSNLKFS